ncbi:hypothetical protein ABK040_011240 [Willaertia magna]
MDSLAEYRKLQEERFKQKQQQQTSTITPEISTNTTTTNTVGEGRTIGSIPPTTTTNTIIPTNNTTIIETTTNITPPIETTINTTNNKKLKLKEYNIDEIIKQREENAKLLIFNEINKDKKKFKEKLLEKEKENLKMELLEKEKLIKQLRNDPYVKGNKKKINNSNMEIDIITINNEDNNKIEYDPCIVNIKLLNNENIKITFNGNDKLITIINYLYHSIYSNNNNLNKEEDNEINYLKLIIFNKIYDKHNINNFTLKQVGLYPKGSLFLSIDTINGIDKNLIIKKEDYNKEEINNLKLLEEYNNKYKLKGDSYEDKLKFRERQTLLEKEKIKKEKLEKKRELELIRMKLKEDKLERMEKLNKKL